MNIPDTYKVDHLFLLIGENPLPNYVAAKTLLREGGKPYFVYTTHTQKALERLQEVLEVPEEERQKSTVALENYESNAHEIRQRIHNKITEIWEKESKQQEPKLQFGLNYTGGTKAMAVHSYQAFLELKDLKPVVFSYLDYRTMQMMFDNPIPAFSVKDKASISLKQLFQLHGLSLSKDPKTEVVYPELVSVLIKAENLKAWKFWCHKVLQVQGKTQTEITTINDSNAQEIKLVELGNWKNKDELKSMLLNIQELPEEIQNVLISLDITEDGKKLSISKLIEQEKIPKPSKNSKYPGEICKWLDGIWLEDYVLQKIKRIQREDENMIDEFGMSFNFPPKANITEFEFDVAFLRGYQLFALSCTTDDKGLCKLKLFEAYRRAKQMGGDEARVALVCCSNNPSKIRKDFLAQIKDEKVQVFGSQDLPELRQKLQSWIKEVEK
ncbi:MAG: Card1-like endonuclease domain-containing protein [Halothece sp.]